MLPPFTSQEEGKVWATLPIANVQCHGKNYLQQQQKIVNVFKT